MRNYSCAFANSCPSFEADNCQGCGHCRDTGVRSSVGKKIYETLLRNNQYVKKALPVSHLPEIKSVIFNRPATIVIWADGDKTVVKCQEDENWSEYVGLSMAISKKALGNKGNYNNVFKKWIPGYGEEETK